MNADSRWVEVAAGRIAYEDTGGDGPVVVLIHGLAMDGRQWGEVVAELRSDYRCILPTLPMGAHLEPMRPDADLSLRGMVRILAEFLERLDLSDVTLCFNDWCGGPVMIADGRADRVGRLVFVSCEAFENYPPGLAGHAAWLSAKIPGGVSLMRETLLRPRLSRLPFIFGQMAKHPVPEELMRSWMEPLRRPEIRRDFRKYTGAAMAGRRDLLAATAALGSFKGPVLVAWDSEGKMMPNEHGRRLAEAFSDSRLVEIAEAYTLVPLDQPKVLSGHMREFLAAA